MFLALLLCLPPRGSGGPELRQVQSSEDLARFLYAMTTNTAAVGDLLPGLDKAGTITIPSYSNAIPIREIYATIVAERFADSLDARLYQHGKKYPVRETCSFRDGRDQVWRFHISIFDKRQYRLMRSFLRKELDKNPMHPTMRLQATPDSAFCQYRASLARRA